MVETLGPFNLQRVFRAVDRLHERLLRATRALDTAGILYAVAGGNAVANWVSRVDEAAVRFTRDIDILLRREDLKDAAAALKSADFHYRKAAGVHMFLDGPDGSAREAIHVVLAGEKVLDEYARPAPDVDESERGPDYHVLALEALVRMKLTSFRRKDQVHLLDMMDVGLIDAGWIDRLPPELGTRLKELVESPDE